MNLNQYRKAKGIPLHAILDELDMTAVRFDELEGGAIPSRGELAKLRLATGGVVTAYSEEQKGGPGAA